MQTKNPRVLILDFTLLFVIYILLYSADQDQWKTLFAKEHASKVRDSPPYLVCVGLIDTSNSLLGRNLIARRKLSAKVHMAALDSTKKANA
jgi:hypothetical protein